MPWFEPQGRTDLTDLTTGNDQDFARDLATNAGQGLLELRDRLGFANPDSLRSAGDRGSHEQLLEALERRRPDDAVLSEEGADDRRRLTAKRVWIIDPLDGTREFAEEGRDDWAVHVALWERGFLTAGAVALPAQGLTLDNGGPPALPQPADAPRIAVSRTRPPQFVRELAERIGAELVPMGSAGAKIAGVLLGQVDAYVHAGGQYEWDSAAPVAVAVAAGAHASRIDGSPLMYNQIDPRLPDLCVCHPDLAPRILQAISEVSNGARNR